MPERLEIADGEVVWPGCVVWFYEPNLSEQILGGSVMNGSPLPRSRELDKREVIVVRVADGKFHPIDPSTCRLTREAAVAARQKQLQERDKEFKAALVDIAATQRLLSERETG